MKRYLKLVNFEVNRFFKLYLVLIGVIFVVQMLGAIIESRQFINLANRVIYEEMLPKEQFIENYGHMSFLKLSGTLWFIGPILISIATLIIYTFFIWYRDWLGKNTFIYRLLMLPTERLNVYLAKLTTILLLVLGLVALQLLLFPVENQVIHWLVPDEFIEDISLQIILTDQFLHALFPPTFIEFILYYGAGIACVSLIFTAILFERCYRLKGVFYGILFCVAALLIFIAPLFVDSFLLGNFFYPLELLGIEVAVVLLILTAAIWTGNYLLKNKIRV